MFFVTATTSCFLNIALDRRRMVDMDSISNIGFVNTHTKSFGSNHHVLFILIKQLHVSRWMIAADKSSYYQILPIGPQFCRYTCSSSPDIILDSKCSMSMRAEYYSGIGIMLGTIWSKEVIRFEARDMSNLCLRCLILIKQRNIRWYLMKKRIHPVFLFCCNNVL